jgi:putative methionine-R-sulfoxide reductase with GAF domain
MKVIKEVKGYMLSHRLHNPTVGNNWISVDSDAFVVTNLETAKKLYESNGLDFWTGIYRVQGSEIEVEMEIGPCLVVKRPSKMMVLEKVCGVAEAQKQTKRAFWRKRKQMGK